MHCCSQPFQHLPESTIFLVQGLKIWLLIRSISPVFTDIYFAKILHSFYLKKKIAHCLSQPVQHLPEWTISPFRVLRFGYWFAAFRRFSRIFILRKYSIVFIKKQFEHCRSQPFQHLSESTIFLIQGLRIWLLIRSISPVFADIYFAKMLHRFYRITICALPLATFSIFAGVNYIPHSGTKNLATDSRYFAGFCK